MAATSGKMKKSKSRTLRRPRLSGTLGVRPVYHTFTLFDGSMGDREEKVEGVVVFASAKQLGIVWKHDAEETYWYIMDKGRLVSTDNGQVWIELAK